MIYNDQEHFSEKRVCKKQERCMVIFILGGSGSGKSEYAESLAVRLGQENVLAHQKENLQDKLVSCGQFSSIQKSKLVYIATMEPLDSESRARVCRHRKQRADKQFETRECYTHIEELSVQKNEILLLECLSNLTANGMFSPAGRKTKVSNIIENGLIYLAKQSLHLVVVGNNVFEDGNSYDEKTREYLQEMAKVHQFLAAHADRVVEVICGIPIEWRAV